MMMGQQADTARIAHRDRVLIACLAAIGALFAAILAITDPPLRMLYVTGPLCLGATTIVNQHSMSVGLLVHYIRTELAPALHTEQAHAPLWEESSALARQDRSNVFRRSLGECAILGGPLLAALIANMDDACNSGFIPGFGWWTSAVLLVWTGILFLDTYSTRQNWMNTDEGSNRTSRDPG